MKTNSRLKFIVALTEHRHLGAIFVPYLVEPLSAYYSVKYIVRAEEMQQLEYSFSAEETEIIQLCGKYADSKLTSRFSRFKNSTEFYSQISPENFTAQVLPYVWKQLYAVSLILMRQSVTLFEKEPKYANLYEEDVINVYPDFARVRYLFNRKAEGTTYRVRIFKGEEEVLLLNRKARIVAGTPCVLQVRNSLLVFCDLEARRLQPFLEREAIFVPAAIEPKYYGNFVLQMVRDYPLEAEGFTIQVPEAEAGAVLCLEQNLGGQPSLVLRIIYGKREILVNDPREVLVHMEQDGQSYTFVKYIRNRTREEELATFLNKLGLKEEKGSYVLPAAGRMTPEDSIYAVVEWLSGNQEELGRQNIMVRQTFYGSKYYIGSVKLDFDVVREKDWFDVYGMVKIGDYTFPFVKLRKYILNGIREFELPNGQMAVLPEEWFAQYRHLLLTGRREGERLVFDRHFFHLLKGRIPGRVPAALERFQEELEHAVNIPVPAGLNAKMRSYQVKGFQWMHSLLSNGLGGCLADDMGLGKTLQTLALLLSMKRKEANTPVFFRQGDCGQLSLFGSSVPEPEGQPSSLIMVPTSLVHNWVNEIRKFAPSLKVYVHAGTQRRRNREFGEMVRRCDIILTTYGTLRNDLTMLEKYNYFIVILDESQYIKNKSSRTFDAVMALKANHHLVLTGTPIENSLSDLWAQMNFLNRGLLGSYPFFRQNYQTPIETHADEAAGERLQMLIRPFILRRKKDEVAEDLPPLVESVMYCSMTPGQHAIYEKEKTEIRNAILSSIESNGLGGSSIVILKGLTRLRQLANHSSMAKTGEEAGSGKLEEIIMVLNGLVAEGHKVLIFSSFVTHLELIADRIREEGWKYSVLTGKTRDRESVIKGFQEEPDNRIFLISLKAGGVGLNLTRADYVFIVDPWWNPASENQAISRAHRIGQDKHVFVYRFITENSIEEKIEQLKEKKSALADRFINSNNPFQTASREELISLFE